MHHASIHRAKLRAKTLIGSARQSRLTAIAVTTLAADVSGFLFEHDLFGKPVPTFPDHALGAADQYPDREHDHAAEYDLECGLQERRVHVLRADEGDRP